MPPTVAALVVVISGAPDQGEITLNPMPAPNARRTNVMAAATKPPAMMAGQETADTGDESASTMTVSTIRAPRAGVVRRGCNAPGYRRLLRQPCPSRAASLLPSLFLQRLARKLESTANMVIEEHTFGRSRLHRRI